MWSFKVDFSFLGTVGSHTRLVQVSEVVSMKSERVHIPGHMR